MFYNISPQKIPVSTENTEQTDCDHREINDKSL